MQTLASRFMSPGKLGESVSSSHSFEPGSPFSMLKRPDRRKLGSSSLGSTEPQAQIVRKEGFIQRKEGFDTPASSSPRQSDSGSNGDLINAQLNAGQRMDIHASPSRQPGLLARTLSSSAANQEALKVVQEKLEHCLGSRPSLGQDVDGESLAYLKALQGRYPVFQAPAVGVAFNIASFSYNESAKRRVVMKQSVETACILAELGADESAVAAALLKDVLVQSMMTEAQLRPLVSKQVADLVVNVGRLDDICQIRYQMVEAASGKPMDVETSQKISHLLMTLADYKGVLVKLADRLAALQIAVRTKAPNMVRSANEALEVFAPIANRLGVWSIKAALEDLAFKVLYPKEHSELHTKLKESQDRGTIESALDDLSKVLQAKGVRGVDLSGRPKNLFGVMTKMQNKNKGLDEVYDVRALRVIVQTKNDCYAVLREVYNMWPEVAGCFKDYIRYPKGNGYRSLHTVVQLPDGRPMEIQIRTDKMHFIAEYGVAAHWRYKESDSVATSQSEEQQVNWARWLISWSLELNDAKCRPKGSPPNDSTLATLAEKLCSFPNHAPECRFLAWASRVIPRPITEEQLAEQPAMVVLLDHTRGETVPTTSIKELPPRSTVADLASQICVPHDSYILINMVEAHDGSQILANGDRVEICLAPKSKKLSNERLEQERKSLQRIYSGHSPPTPQKVESLPRPMANASRK